MATTLLNCCLLIVLLLLRCLTNPRQKKWSFFVTIISTMYAFMFWTLVGKREMRVISERKKKKKSVNRGVIAKRRNSSALAMEVRLSCSNPSILVCCIIRGKSPILNHLRRWHDIIKTMRQMTCQMFAFGK